MKAAAIEVVLISKHATIFAGRPWLGPGLVSLLLLVCGLGCSRSEIPEAPLPENDATEEGFQRETDDVSAQSVPLGDMEITCDYGVGEGKAAKGETFSCKPRSSRQQLRFDGGSRGFAPAAREIPVSVLIATAQKRKMPMANSAPLCFSMNGTGQSSPLLRGS